MISVVLIGPPNVPDNFKVTSHTSTSVCLSWRPGYNGGSTVQFVLIYKATREAGYVSTGPNLPEGTTQYCVKDLEPETKYEFLLMAENKFKGRSESDVTSTQVMTSGKTNHITNLCLTNMVALLCVNYCYYHRLVHLYINFNDRPFNISDFLNITHINHTYELCSC